MKYFGGCDVGSTYTKAVSRDENGKICADTTIRSKINSEQSAKLAMEEVLNKVGLSSSRELAYLIGTDYGRNKVHFADENISEISCQLVYDATGRTSDPDIYGAGDVSGMSPIWPVAVKEGMVAAANMAGKNEKMTDFFASKSTMSFLGINTMSLGIVTPPDDTYRVDMLDEKGVYKKVVSKDGVIVGAILQGDLAYGGVLQQMIARKLDVTRVKKPLFEIDYSDFFHERKDLEFAYED